MTFQQLILKLSEFCASRGCVLQEPLDTEVGAGTMHPKTFLRVRRLAVGIAHADIDELAAEAPIESIHS